MEIDVNFVLEVMLDNIMIDQSEFFREIKTNGKYMHMHYYKDLTHTFVEAEKSHDLWPAS